MGRLAWIIQVALNIITRVLKDRGKKVKEEAGDMRMGARGCVCRGGRGQETNTGSLQKLTWRKHSKASRTPPGEHFDFGPVKLTSDSWSPELQ